MKKSRFLLTLMALLCLICAVLLISCGGGAPTPTPCQHRDADDDSACDKCGEAYTDGIDKLPDGGEETPGGNETPGGDEGGEPPATPGHTHSFGEWVETTAPTCMAKGEETRSCACGESETRDVAIDPTAHSYANTLSYNTTHHFYACACGVKKNEATHVSSGAADVTHAEYCTVCNYVITPAVGIQFKTLTATGTNVFGKVSNATTTFSFLNEVRVTGNAAFKVFTDITCSAATEIVSKTVTLAIGDNTFYVLEYINGEVKALYTVTVRRRELYTVTFNTSGGNTVATQTVEEDDFINVPADPTRTGYTFAGWSRDLTLPITASVTVNAAWTANSYTVTYNANEGTVKKPTTAVAYNAAYTLETPTRTGYTFAGWYDGSALVPVSGTWSIARNVTLVASWTANGSTPYKVEHYTENLDGTYTLQSTDNKTGKSDSSVTPATKTYTGFTAPARQTVTILPDGSLVVRYEYKRNRYTVTFLNEDGTTIETKTLKYEQSYTFRNLAERTGYTFNWYNGNEIFAQLSGTWTVTQNVTLKAQYDANKYTITWKNWDGTVLETVQIEYNSLPTCSSQPQREAERQHYYVFAGWSPEVTLVTGDASYVAQFTRHEYTEYTVEYKLNGGTGSFAAQTKPKGEAILLSSKTPSRSGYKFIGWNNIYENTVYSAGDSFALDENVVLWAMWQETPDCEACYGGKITNQTMCAMCKGAGRLCSSCSWGGTITYTAYVGYHCTKCGSTQTKTCTSSCNDGYKTSTETCSECKGVGYHKVEEAAPVAATVQARAVTLVSKSGYEYSMDGITWQSSPVFENLKVHTTYHFYQRRATSGEIPFGNRSVALEVTTKTDSTYYISYELNGGSNHASNPESYAATGAAITLLPPTREHYVFGGWTYNGETVTSISPAWNDDVTLVAHWLYTITYELNGGSADNPDVYSTEGGELTLIAPTKNGYTFVGWTGSNGNTPQLTVTIPARNEENLSYTAHWALTVYTITYNFDGGTVSGEMEPTTYTVEDRIELSIIPYKEYYEFIGWYDGETQVAELNGNYCKNLTLTAKWKSIFVRSGNAITGLTDHGKTYSSIVLPNQLDGVKITSIRDSAFSGCTGLTSVTISDSVTSIGKYAFSDCSSLTEINFNATAMNDLSSGNYVFANAGQSGSGITVNIGANVTRIPAYLFYSLSNSGLSPNLTCVKFAENSKCESIGSDAFYNCTGLTSVTIPASVTSIGEYAFYFCDKLTTVEFGANSQLTSIGSDAFLTCTGLTSVTIPASVTSIGSEAFRACTGLTTVTIPASVTSIGSKVFANCSGLESIKVASGNTVYHSAGNCLIETASKTLVAGCKNSVIPTDGSVTAIGSSAFYACDGLTSVTIPASVTSIGSYAFFDCDGLTTVTIPTSVTSIGDDAFYSCSSLASITFEEPSGWYRTNIYSNWNNKTGGTATSLAKPATNATYFKSTYRDYYWYKPEK